MRTFARKPKMQWHAESSKSTDYGRIRPRQACDANSVLHLQRMIGNQAVQRLLANSGDRTPVQTPMHGPLMVNTPGDTLEKEAERFSELVMQMPEAHSEAVASSAAVASQSEATSTGGMPLPASQRAFFESSFKHGFDDVRIHADAGAHAMAARLHAQAFTAGRDIYFAAGKYAPSMNAGRGLLAHELAHVVQQSSGRVTAGMVQRAEDWNFTPARFEALTKNKGALKFDSDSNWFPKPFQDNLKDTLNFVLDPTRKKPATQGVNTTDFFHGHIAMKGQQSDELYKLTGEYNKISEAEYTKALGGSRINELTTKNLPAYKTAVENTLPSAKAMLEAAAKLKDVVVIYHTFENNKPGDMKYGSPERNFITPLGGSPKPYSPPNPDSAGSWADEYKSIHQFNFLVDQNGIIHVRPGFASSSQELSTVTGKPEK